MNEALLEVLERARGLGYLGPGPVDRHVAQALVFRDAVERSPSTCADLGPGGGVPGLVLAVAWPSSHWLFVELGATRAAFLVDAVAELGLDQRVTVVARAAEDVAREPSRRSSCEIVTARSFGPPATAAECGAPLLAEGGLLLVSEPPQREDGRWPGDKLRDLGLSDEGEWRTDGGAVRRLRRTGPLDDGMPRRAGVPHRRPLWRST